jgi:hypothetical protein
MLKLLAGISMIALAVPAVAQNIYDSNNTMVGPLVSLVNTTGTAVTKLNNELHFLSVVNKASCSAATERCTTHTPGIARVRSICLIIRPPKFCRSRSSTT